MPFDDRYRKIKDQSPGSFPPFDEESWKKMELLLDKHLPEKKRRFFPYLLFFGCVIVALLTTFLPAKRSTQLEEGSISNASNLTSKPVQVIEKSEVQQVPVAVDESIDRSTDLELQPKKTVAADVVQIKSNQQGLLFGKTGKVETKQEEFISPTIPDAPMEVSVTPIQNVTLLTNRKNFLVLPNEPAKNSSLIATNKKNAPAKKPVKNNFSFTFSTGLEAPGTAFNTWGRVTPLVGVGVQYSFRNKIVLRTGIAMATKIYSAGGKDYNPSGYWYSYVTFNKIDADCKITEIPLSIAYRVASGRQTSLFVSAGASSYIMRKEAYEYYYKNQYGNDTVVNRSFNNNSFHLFSGVNVSVIAERKITDRFSLMAEPIIKIPTAGIGYGKVRLYNAGVTVSARFQLR